VTVYLKKQARLLAVDRSCSAAAQIDGGRHECDRPVALTAREVPRVAGACAVSWLLLLHKMSGEDSREGSSTGLLTSLSSGLAAFWSSGLGASMSTGLSWVNH
jgi:hypothetical protein